MPRHYEFFVYIAANVSRTLYTGVTNDLERLSRRNAGPKSLVILSGAKDLPCHGRALVDVRVERNTS